VIIIKLRYILLLTFLGVFIIFGCTNQIEKPTLKNSNLIIDNPTWNCEIEKEKCIENTTCLISADVTFNLGDNKVREYYGKYYLTKPSSDASCFIFVDGEKVDLQGFSFVYVDEGKNKINYRDSYNANHAHNLKICCNIYNELNEPYDKCSNEIEIKPFCVSNQEDVIEIKTSKCEDPSEVECGQSISPNNQCPLEQIGTKCPYNKECVAGNCIDASYSKYFDENPRVLEIISYNNDQEEIDYFFDYINELETSGSIDIKKPNIQSTSEGNCKLDLTNEQEKRIRAAKAAHAVWLDKNRILPWTFSQYNDEGLMVILGSEKNLGMVLNGEPFVKWELVNLGVTNECSTCVVDYSPSEAYDYAKQFIKKDALATTYALITDLRSDFVHGSAYYNDSGPLPYTLNDALTTYSRGGEYRVSRLGCQSMVRIIVALLKSVNVPAYYDQGWYAALDGYHASAFFPTIQKILIHGDDIYGLESVPIEELLMPYSYFNEEVKPCEKNTQCADEATYKYNFQKIVDYPHEYYLDCSTQDFCENCIEERVRDESTVKRLTNEELQEAIEKISAEVCS